VPWRATVVEEALAGKDIKATAKAAAALIRNQARPLSNNAYKVDIAVGLTERMLLSLAA
jgi:CO/xanthine dehydrogenase FAD-binding subunit